MTKAWFWQEMEDRAPDDRQRTMLNRLLDGFEGTLTSTTWAALTSTSPDTALRDITDLVDRGVLARDLGGWAKRQLFTCGVDDRLHPPSHSCVRAVSGLVCRSNSVVAGIVRAVRAISEIAIQR